MKEPVSRRSFLAGACGLFVLSGVQALPASANSAVKKLSNGKLSVQLSKIDALAQVGGSVRIGIIKGSPVAVTRTGTSSYIAYSLRCPHQGIPVKKTETGWRCEEHGSEFEPDGDLILGPATTRLPRIPMRVSRGIATVG
jgi:Rieske Fe-S protein